MSDLDDLYNLFLNYFSDKPNDSSILNEILQSIQNLPKTNYENVHLETWKKKILYDILMEIVLNSKISTPCGAGDFYNWLSRKIEQVFVEALSTIQSMCFSLEKESVDLTWQKIYQIVSSNMDRLNELDVTIPKLKYQRDLEYKNLTNVVKDCNDLIEKVLQINGQKHAEAMIQTQCTWARCLVEVSDLKLETLQLEINQDNIGCKKNEILQYLQNILTSQKHALKYELQHVTQISNAYENSDPIFKQLVEQYDELKKTLENKKWALKECKNNI
ncbi:hypothetical protein HZS_1265 [Henneguya salminicola]|nr:hypothetical protein HZS_1265 [Henneguya salminicola]